MKVKIIKQVLNPKFKLLTKPRIIVYSLKILPKYPPINNITENMQIRTILAYSAKKKNRK